VTETNILSLRSKTTSSQFIYLKVKKLFNTYTNYFIYKL